MKKKTETRFIVAVLAPGLLLDEIEGKITYFRHSEKPLLFISGQSKLRAIMPDIACSYDFFQQCIALPEDVDPETLESKMQDGLMVFTFMTQG